MDYSDVYYSENPEEDIWLNLKRYSFVENIYRYYKDSEVNPSEDLVEAISGSILQAYEYFQASKTATIQTAPLLLYYGATNLLFAASCLLKGEIVKVNGHGMKLVDSNKLNKNILKNKVKLVDPSAGGFSVYLSAITGKEIPNNSEWSILELLGSIPEIYKEFVELLDKSDLYLIPLERVISDEEDSFTSNSKVLLETEVESKIQFVINYRENYLKYGTTRSGKVVFRTKLNGESLVKQSFFNENYFPVGHEKNGKLYDFDSLFYEYLILFTLGTICRYHPQIWTPFVRLDNSGEVNFIEKFLNTSRRYFPNIILDKLQGERHFYSNQLYVPNNIRTNISEKELDAKLKNIIAKLGGNLDGNI